MPCSSESERANASYLCLQFCFLLPAEINAFFFILFFFFSVRALGASAEPGNLPQGLLRYVCMALLVGLYNVSNFCGKIGAFIPVLRRRICLESGQKAFKVASGFTQLWFLIIQSGNTGPGGVAASGNEVPSWWCNCLCLVLCSFQNLR